MVKRTRLKYFRIFRNNTKLLKMRFIKSSSWAIALMNWLQMINVLGIISIPSWAFDCKGQTLVIRTEMVPETYLILNLH
jgi:hypothetical protein